MYEGDHEKEISQSEGETMKKVIINEASTLVSTVINLKVPPEGFGSPQRCTRAQRFHPENDHWSVAGRHSSQSWFQQTVVSPLSMPLITTRQAKSRDRDFRVGHRPPRGGGG